MRGSFTFMKLKWKQLRSQINEEEQMALSFYDLVLRQGGSRTEARQAMLASLME